MHPRDGVVVVVNVRNGLHQKVAGKVGWPEDWWPTLEDVESSARTSHFGASQVSPKSAEITISPISAHHHAFCDYMARRNQREKSDLS